MQATLEAKVNTIQANALADITVVARQDIPAIHRVEVNGVTHELGEHRDFRRNALLQQFLPDQARLSLSWVHLNDSKTLQVHQHPTASMILVCKGAGFLTGQKPQALKEGDVVIVPPNCDHGFIGEGALGLSALSIQFDEAGGLYENPDNYLVTFKTTANGGSLEKLLAHNQTRLEQIKTCRFFKMLEDGTLLNEKKCKRYLDSLEVWTMLNQLLLFSRQATCVDPKYDATFLQHFNEEIGHDVLYSERADKGNFQDPVIEAIASWFVHQMFIRDNIEKAAIIHLVIENTSHYYHHLAKPILISKGTQEYYEAHTCDDDHAQMGIDLLRGESDATYQKLIPVLDKAWDMITAMVERVADLTERS